MEFYEEQLDLTNNRIAELEKTICILQNDIQTIAIHVKEMQHFMIKMAKNQSDITKRVSQWPYIAVSDNEGDDRF